VNGRAGCYAWAAEPRVKFTGKERDAETGLDYFGARYLSGVQGRFVSADAPFVDQHVEDSQSWNLYSYVRNNPLRYTDPTGNCLRRNETMESCGDYLIGGAMAIGNIPSDIVNLPNRLTNILISPLTDFRLQDLIPTTFQPTNTDQAQGMEAMQVSLLVAGVGEAVTAVVPGSTTATTVVSNSVSGGRLGSAATRAQNAAIADSLESRGFTIKGGGGRLPEEYLPGPGGGRAGGTFVDVTAVRNTRTVRVQTIDTRADGITPTTREANAAVRIRAQQRPRDHTVLIPKRK
jgi:RHS repeat-associated protein